MLHRYLNLLVVALAAAVVAAAVGGAGHAAVAASAAAAAVAVVPPTSPHLAPWPPRHGRQRPTRRRWGRRSLLKCGLALCTATPPQLPPVGPPTTTTTSTSTNASSSVATVPTDPLGLLSDPVLAALAQRYKGRLVPCAVAQYPHCEVLLCGTLHVARTSVDMVREAIRALRPQYVVLELCEARIDNLLDAHDDPAAANVTLVQVVREAWRERSARVLGMGLLTWMQLKAAKVVGNKLGGELSVAAQEGIASGATVVLGDRLYGVTIQRVFDALGWREKIKMVAILLWEVVTMSFFKLKDYIQKSEDEAGFVEDEIARFGRHLPVFAKVLIQERDEYLAQSILDIAKVVGQAPAPGNGQGQGQGAGRPRIMAVVGAGHLAGIQRCLAAGGVSEDRVREISCSSKHPGGTWLGRGMMHVLSPTVFQDMLKEQEQQQQQQQQQQQATIPPPAPTPVAAAADTAVPTSPSDIPPPPQEAASAAGEGEAAGADGSARLAGQANSVIQLLSQLTTAVEAANTAVATARAAAAAHQQPLSPEINFLLEKLGATVGEAKTRFVAAEVAERAAAAGGDDAAARLGTCLADLSTAIIAAGAVAKTLVDTATDFAAQFETPQSPQP